MYPLGVRDGARVGRGRQSMHTRRTQWDSPDAIIRQVVGRRHVGDSTMSVIRYAVSRLKNGYATLKTADATQRRMFFEMVAAEHRENRELYSSVMGGRI